MSEPFEYTILRAVPRIDRGECVNVAVLLYCQAFDFLDLAGQVDPGVLQALDPAVDLAAVAEVLDGARRVCADTSWPVRDRFGWLSAPRSTVVQPSPVHCGLTADPADTLARLFARLVARP